MNILSILICVAVVAFTGYQVYLFIRDINRKRKIKKQNKDKKDNE